MLMREVLDLMKTSYSSNHLLGLYAFAIEEYGKLLILEDCLNQQNDPCKVPKYLFSGRDAHNKKFSKALDNLPDVCKRIPIEEEEFINYKAIFRDDHTIESIPHGFTIRSMYNFIDFQIRMGCFYLDWDYEKSNWKRFPVVDDMDLEVAIKKFHEILLKKFETYSIDN